MDKTLHIFVIAGKILFLYFVFLCYIKYMYVLTEVPNATTCFCVVVIFMLFSWVV